MPRDILVFPNSIRWPAHTLVYSSALRKQTSSTFFLLFSFFQRLGNLSYTRNTHTHNRVVSRSSNSTSRRRTVLRRWSIDNPGQQLQQRTRDTEIMTVLISSRRVCVSFLLFSYFFVVAVVFLSFVYLMVIFVFIISFLALWSLGFFAHPILGADKNVKLSLRNISSFFFFFFIRRDCTLSNTRRYSSESSAFV